MKTKVFIILTIFICFNDQKICFLNAFQIHLCVKKTPTGVYIMPCIAVGIFTPVLPINSRIIGGYKVDISEVPYQLSLELYGKLVCGASIISPNWAVTAAHCFPDAYPVSLMTIRSGTSKATNYGQLHNLQRVIIHNNYHFMYNGIPVHDIAVVNVKQPFTYNERKRKPIVLYNAEDPVPSGSVGIISGWGLLSEDRKNLPVDLHKARVAIVSHAECQRTFPHLPRGQICAGFPTGGVDACSGDSGGPLVVNNKLVGIVSWGYGCARPNYPGVYTEVSFYRQWIKTHTGV